jgi:hypothetical protein
MSHAVLARWMADFEAFQEAMDARRDCHSYLGRQSV